MSAFRLGEEKIAGRKLCGEWQDIMPENAELPGNGKVSTAKVYQHRLAVKELVEIPQIEANRAVKFIF